jgi:hypothetical protein
LGIAIVYASDQVLEVDVRYDDIHRYTFGRAAGAERYEGMPQGTVTNVIVDVKKDMLAPVYLYYRLVNFYQNHRGYSESRNDLQLMGKSVTRAEMVDCAPFRSPGEFRGSQATRLTVGAASTNYGRFVYSPCGLCAWSMFNDSFILWRASNASQAAPAGPITAAVASALGLQLICNATDFDRHGSRILLGNNENPCEKRGISWPSDVEERFKPSVQGADIWSRDYVASNPGREVSDVYLRNGWYANEPGHALPVTVDEDFHVWMRIASLPAFRKLHRVINMDLPAGRYVMSIVERYDVASFEGEKHIVLATASWTGGANYLLGGLHLAIGFLALVEGFAFLIRYCVQPTREAPNSRIY